MGKNSSSQPSLSEGPTPVLGLMVSSLRASPPLPNFRLGLRAFCLIFGLSLSLAEPIFYPAPAAARFCFFWQACAQRRGQASNTQGGGKRTGRIRGGNDPAIPYVISPRNTWIGEPPETIRWNPVAGAARYTVTLWQWSYARDTPIFSLWETTVEGANETAFPSLVLEPGIYYSIEVVAEGDVGAAGGAAGGAAVSSDQDEGYLHSGFQLLFEEDYQVLRSRLAQVNAAEAPTPEEATLAEAGVYFLDEMYADALQTLAPLTLNPTASDLVYTALGDTYSKMGLNLLAIESYDWALARANNNLLSEATILVNQADVYATLGDFDQAQQLLAQARIAYSLLGAEIEVAILNRRIEVLSTAQWQSP